MFLSRYWIVVRYLAVFCIILTTVLSFTITENGKRKGPLIERAESECNPKTVDLLNARVCYVREWNTVQVALPLGLRDSPGYSCKDIMENGNQATDGVYCITLTGKFVILL